MTAANAPAKEYQKGDFLVSSDPRRVDLDLVHEFLTNSYWAKGIPRATVARSIENSLCFGIYRGQEQVGFARIVSDFATYAYLADVFVLESCRGQGLGKWLMECILSHPPLQGLRRWSLVTCDAHGLYGQFGFAPLENPHRWMERHSRDIYERART